MYLIDTILSIYISSKQPSPSNDGDSHGELTEIEERSLPALVIPIILLEYIDTHAGSCGL